VVYCLVRGATRTPLVKKDEVNDKNPAFCDLKCGSCFKKARVLNFDKNCALMADRDRSVGTAVHYGPDSPGIESQWVEARFSAPAQTRSGAHQLSYTKGTGSFRGLKRPET